MINVEIIGMDRYMMYDYSHDITKNLANIYETKTENIFFSGGDSKLVHDGNDQTSWHVLMRVHAPNKYHCLEKQVADFLLKTAADYVLNVHVVFVYFEEHHIYHKINDEYPLFIEHREETNVEYSYEDVDDEEIYDGNVFENFEEKLEKADEERCKHGDCDCHHHHNEN